MFDVRVQKNYVGPTLFVSFVPYPISEFFCSANYFLVALIFRVAIFCCALVPGTLALELPTLIL